VLSEPSAACPKKLSGHETGSGRTYISELERGLKGPSLKMVFRLAATLDIEPSVLVERVEVLVAPKHAN
jgi:transcriptional regulator with XRE-family HTH domain